MNPNEAPDDYNQNSLYSILALCPSVSVYVVGDASMKHSNNRILVTKRTIMVHGHHPCRVDRNRNCRHHRRQQAAGPGRVCECDLAAQPSLEVKYPCGPRVADPPGYLWLSCST